MQQIELISLLKKAVKKFYENDNLLVCKGGMEQACVFRIGIYLNELIKNHPRFNNLNLDCEYNKSSRGNKRLRGISVRPDLIIHERNFNPDNINDNNTLIIEFKGWWNKNTRNDIDKLIGLTSIQDGYNYKLGIFIKLGKTQETTTFKYYIMGREVLEHDLS